MERVADLARLFDDQLDRVESHAGCGDRTARRPSRDRQNGCMAPGEVTLTLSRSELRLVEAALRAYLDDFGHDEADLLRELKALVAKVAGFPSGSARGVADQSTVTEL